MTKNALCQIYLYKVSQVYHCWLGHSFNITELKYNTIRVTAQKKKEKKSLANPDCLFVLTSLNVLVQLLWAGNKKYF